MICPDAIFLNGRFRTLDPERPAARALASLGGRVLAVGDDAAIRSLAGGETEIVDLGGRLAVPGLVDAHCHLVSYGMTARREADLRGAGSITAIQDRLRAQMSRAGRGSWLLGRGFDQDLLGDGRWPTASDLDAVSESVPIRITRVCGHALVANRAAMRAAGIAVDTGGRSGGGPDDATRGIFAEDAMAPVQRAMPPPGAEEWLAAAAWACDAAAAAGFTGIHCLIANREELNALARLRESPPAGGPATGGAGDRAEGGGVGGGGRLPVRIRLQLPYAMLDAARDVGLITGFGDEWLTIGAIKIFSDGSMGARTAALREDYADDPGNRGQLTFSQEELDHRVQAVADAGFQVAVHAIGDAALESVLTAFERCDGLRPRPRIEHASLCPPDLMARMRALGVVAAVQPQFIRSDFWTPERLGPERARWAYPFRTLLEQGIPLAGSTDCPVERLDALAAWRCAVSRDGRCPQEDLEPEAALRIFVGGSAIAAGEQSVAGMLHRGMRADFVALDGDNLEAITSGDLRVAFTVVGGRSRL